MTEGSGTEAHPTEFEVLLVPVLDSAYRTALRLTGNASDAEDLVQDASFLALRGFGSFRSGSNFKAWFFRIVFNRFYSGYRSRRRRGVAVELGEVPEVAVSEAATRLGLVQEPDPATALLSRLDVDQVTQALDALPDDYRSVATLYFTQEFSYQEIAEVLDIPVGTVRSRLHRARRALQVDLLEVAQERGIVR